MKEKENPNMRYYNSWRGVPQDAMKAFDNGRFKGTDINSMWRIKMLTENFGICGIGWYYTIDKQWLETAGTDTRAFCNISLYIKVDGEWSKPISGTGGNKFATPTKNGSSVSDECYKMAVTDAIGNACKSLGMGADVYWANDRTKYTQDANNVNRGQVQPQQTVQQAQTQVAQQPTFTGADVKKAIDALKSCTEPQEVLDCYHALKLSSPEVAAHELVIAALRESFVKLTLGVICLIDSVSGLDEYEKALKAAWPSMVEPKTLLGNAIVARRKEIGA